MTAATASMTLSRPVGDSWTGPITVSIIISTYDAREMLADCLQSIYDNPPSEPYEIVLVDDASTDGTSEMVRSRFPEVRLICNEVNRHYTKSNNHAIDLARGQYLYLLNNDTIVLPHAFDRMVAFLRGHPDAGAVGSKLINPDGTTQWTAKSLPNLASGLFGGRGMMTRMFPNNRFSRRRFLHFNRDTTEPFVAGYISGASKMVPRKVVDKVGYLDERLFYHVDADYCIRIAEAGYKCYSLPSAEVIHLNHDDGRAGTTKEKFRRSWSGAHASGDSLAQRFRHMLKFHVQSYYYYRKHMQRGGWSPMRVVVPLGFASHFLALLVVQSFTELVGLVRGPSHPNERKG